MLYHNNPQKKSWRILPYKVTLSSTTKLTHILHAHKTPFCYQTLASKGCIMMSINRSLCSWAEGWLLRYKELKVQCHFRRTKGGLNPLLLTSVWEKKHTNKHASSHHIPFKRPLYKQIRFFTHVLTSACKRKTCLIIFSSSISNSLRTSASWGTSYVGSKI